ncbi:zinc finger C-x8-C-x5-C-x3-H type, putative [Plasmodium ovale curtisi]|nr:zinc finger C-x8-C-x5-C-x3-H type, putative [Plasmodium ovale curtisi]SBS87626.1 zinc finger C-x8-C-x5-C-x3-H type, putative [Plasmodium ovale curtisi]
MTTSSEIKHQFAKTKICKHFLENKCLNTKNCNYAHVLEELRPLPNLKNTKLCKSLKKNVPCNNPNCKYAHEIEKLQPTTDLATYKTTLCYFWKKKKCMNQGKCRFAHGIEEIRPFKCGIEALSEHRRGRSDRLCGGGDKKNVGGEKRNARSGRRNVQHPRRNPCFNTHVIESQQARQEEQQTEGQGKKEPEEVAMEEGMEEGNIRELLANLNLFDSLPTIENDLSSFDESFLNFIQNEDLNFNIFPTMEETNYSMLNYDDVELYRSLDSLPFDINLVNFDYLLRENENQIWGTNKEGGVSRGAGMSIGTTASTTVSTAVYTRTYTPTDTGAHTPADTGTHTPTDAGTHTPIDADTHTPTDMGIFPLADGSANSSSFNYEPATEELTDAEFLNDLYKSIKEELSKNFANVYSY